MEDGGRFKLPELNTFVVLVHAKADPMMLGFCLWLLGHCYAVAGMFCVVAR